MPKPPFYCYRSGLWGWPASRPPHPGQQNKHALLIAAHLQHTRSFVLTTDSLVHATPCIPVHVAQRGNPAAVSQYGLKGRATCFQLIFPQAQLTKSHRKPEAPQHPQANTPPAPQVAKQPRLHETDEEQRSKVHDSPIRHTILNLHDMV